LVDALGPQQRFRGSPRLGGSIYFVFVFKKCVIAECPDWGNALYLLTPAERWQQVFGLAKSDALVRPGMHRIIHRGDWARRLKQLMLKLGERPTK
jgi:hypothetical protein